MNNPDTIESLQALSPDELRVRVAKAVGWRQWQDEESGILGGDWSKTIWTPPGKTTLGDAKAEPTNYPASLDSCREFENAMNFSERQRYVANLQKVMSVTLTSPNLVHHSACVFATPLQKCQAYILTKGAA